MSTNQAANDSPLKAPPPAGRRPNRRTKLLLLLAGIAVALVLAEIGARLFVAVTHRVPLIVSDSRAGWVLQPNLRNTIRGGDGGQFVINTDAEGHRITRGADEPSAAGSPTVLIVGDSYAQSTGVEDREAFPWILAHEMPLNVVNLGVLGYGTEQELISLEAYLEAHPVLDVRDIVVFITANDFSDVQCNYHYLGRNKPRFRLANGRLDRGSFHLTLSDRLMDLSYFYWLANSQYALRFAPQVQEPLAGSDLIIACAAAMRDAATRRGARIHVLVHHLREFFPATQSWWEDFARRAGGTDITERLRLPNGANPFVYDGHHWNAEVHKRVAAVVKQRLAATTAP